MRLLYIFLFFVPHYLWSQSLDVDSLETYISKLVAEYNMPGLAIGVIHNDTVLFKKGYGVTSAVDSLPVTTQTIFPILSCTKAFTATCLGILVDEGKLKWNDKVIKYLPDFKLSDPWITREITISDLMRATDLGGTLILRTNKKFYFMEEVCQGINLWLLYIRSTKLGLLF